jgi:hypothetical protein
MGHSLKAISMVLRGDGLIFEGLRRASIYAREVFCDEFFGVNPQRSDHCGVQWNLF